MVDASELSLKKVNKRNYEEVIDLSVNPKHQDYIEPNIESLVEAAYDVDGNWHPYGLYQGKELVGFTMIGEYNPEEKSIWMDRFMIDEEFQHQGLGRKFLELIKEFIQTNWQVEKIYLSYHPENHFAEKMYFEHGFEDTGKMDEEFGEKILVYSV